MATYGPYGTSGYPYQPQQPQQPGVVAPTPKPIAPAAQPFVYQNVGHDGTFNGMNRAQWRDKWMGQGKLSTSAADSWLRSNGAQQVNGKSGVWRTPYGETLDLQIARSAALKNGGTVTAGWGSTTGRPAKGGGVTKPAPNMAPVPVTGTGLGAAAQAATAQGNKLFDMLMARAQQGTAIDRNDPNIKQQVDPFAAAQERARRQYESEAAERLSATGQGDSGAMDIERRIGMERAGQATGQFESELVGRELMNRRQEIATALEQLGGVIGQDKTMALQRELAQLDAALKREGIGVQKDELGLRRQQLAQDASQFNANLAQRGREFDLGQSLNWAQFNWMQDPNNPAYWS